jgi:hypothetical protein
MHLLLIWGRATITGAAVPFDFGFAKGATLMLSTRLVSSMEKCFPDSSIERFPIYESCSALREMQTPDWIAPHAAGNTPMIEALRTARDLVARWIAREENYQSFPPIVFNITDGDCYDADAWSLTDIAHDIASTSTYDGNTLLINIVLQTMGEDDYNTKIFPSDATYYSTNRNRTILLRMSSLFPEGLSAKIKKMFHLEHDGPYRGIAYNTVVTELLNIINIGSENAV